ncbi:unnamed protein product [Blepharisma stoltei]|uniref:Uncharacterized protein n=1 Tax=Blepharisma stoltei TaxID=1481888 RepID=A0AAU9K3Y7_9CILI|nr:unnamed protein product [Blepharisma stoltei]
MQRNVEERQCINSDEEPYASSQIAQMIYMSRKITDLFSGLMMGYLEYMMFYYYQRSLDRRLSEISRNWSNDYFEKLSKVIRDRDCNEFDNMTKDHEFARLINQNWNRGSQANKKISSLLLEFANEIDVSLILYNFEGRISIYGNSDFYFYFAFNETKYEILYPYHDRIESLAAMIQNCRIADSFHLTRKQKFSCGCFTSEMGERVCTQQLSEFELSQAPKFYEIKQCNCSNPNQVFKLWCECSKCEFCAVKLIIRGGCAAHPKKKMKEAQIKSIIHYLNENFSYDRSRTCKCERNNPIARILSYLPQHHNCYFCANCLEKTWLKKCFQCKKTLIAI